MCYNPWGTGIYNSRTAIKKHQKKLTRSFILFKLLHGFFLSTTFSFHPCFLTSIIRFFGPQSPLCTDLSPFFTTSLALESSLWTCFSFLTLHFRLVYLLFQYFFLNKLLYCGLTVHNLKHQFKVEQEEILGSSDSTFQHSPAPWMPIELGNTQWKWWRFPHKPQKQ